VWLYRWLIHVLYVSTVEKLDARRRKSLAQAVPNLAALVSDPPRALAAGDIAIGPQRRSAAVAVTGSLMAIVFWLLIALAVGVVKNGFFPDAAPDPRVLVPATLAAAIVLSMSYTRRRYRGGRCVLTRDGALLTFAGDTVFCPWALFNAAGRTILFFERGSRQFVRRFFVPVCPAAVPYVEARREDIFLFAQGIEVNTPQFRFRSANEAELRAWYEVTADEIGELLLQLGRRLGAVLPERAVTPQELRETASRLAPAAALDGKGWLLASLTRLVFPPACCDCGGPTGTVQHFAAHKPLLRLGRLLKVEASECVWVPVPVCTACQQAGRVRYRQWVFKRVKTAFLGPLFVGLLLLPLVALRNPGAWVAIELGILIVLSLPGAILAYVLARMVGRTRTAPVRLERYSPAKGTVAIRFRRPGYAELVVAATQAAETEPWSQAAPHLPHASYPSIGPNAAGSTKVEESSRGQERLSY
jgi:hypothetical protein